MKHHLSRTNSHEHLWGARDVMDDLALIRGLFPTLIQVSQILGVDADMHPVWDEVVTNLAPYPLREKPWRTVLSNGLSSLEGGGSMQYLGACSDALQQALLQCLAPKPGEDPVVHVFPAWPTEWDAAFQLLARGRQAETMASSVSVLSTQKEDILILVGPASTPEQFKRAVG